MIFDVKDYKVNGVVIRRRSDARGISFLLNPESINESVKSNIDSTQLISNNLPRHIASGTKGREISFNLLLHGMVPYNSQNAQVGQFQGNIDNVVSGTLSLIPFASNVIRGIQSVSDLLNLNLISNAEFDINRNVNQKVMHVDNTIKAMFDLQVPKDGTSVLIPVVLNGYPAFEGMEFYITAIQVNRKFWDKKLNTQFAELSLSLTQTGSNNKVGKFKPSQTPVKRNK